VDRGLRQAVRALILLVGLLALSAPSLALAVDWVQNPAPIELWAGPEADATSLGQAPAGDYFQILTQAANGRLFVFSARTRGQAYVDAAGVVSSGPPSREWLRRAGRPDAEAAAPVDPALGLALSGFPIQADASFTPALEQLLNLKHTWTLQALAFTGTRLEWSLMAPDAAGSYLPDRGVVTFNARWARSDPRALAALIEHEAKHVADALAGLDVTSPSGCVISEVNAFREEAKTWGELVGPGGKPNPADDLERSLNLKLNIYQQNPGGIEALITNNLGYQTQCHLR
jgi:hypothetical protein